MDEKSNGHSHARPIEKLIITFDPQNGTLNYQFEHMDYATALQRLTLLQFLIYDDMKAHQKKQEVTVGH